MTSPYTKPLPRRDGLNAEFYDFCQRRELRFQRCSDCSTWRHLPRESCGQCGSLAWTWQASTGKGKLFSWTTVHRALHPGFADELPYVAAIVELDKGVRMVSSLVDIDPDDVAIDLALEVVFEAVTPEVTLPKFQLAG